MLNGVGSKVYNAGAFVLNPIANQLKATPKTLYAAAAALSLIKGIQAYRATDAGYKAKFTAAGKATGKWAVISAVAVSALHFVWTALASHPKVRLGGAIVGGIGAVVGYAYHKGVYPFKPKEEAEKVPPLSEDS